MENQAYRNSAEFKELLATVGDKYAKFGSFTVEGCDTIVFSESRWPAGRRGWRLPFGGQLLPQAIYKRRTTLTNAPISREVKGGVTAFRRPAGHHHLDGVLAGRALHRQMGRASPTKAVATKKGFTSRRETRRIVEHSSPAHGVRRDGFGTPQWSLPVSRCQ